MQWINGKMSTTYSLSWTLFPTRKGTLQIPSLRVKTDGKYIQSKPITVTVIDRKANRSNEGKKQSEQQYYIEADVDNSNPYRGEQIILTYTLYTKVNLASFDIGEMAFRIKRNIQFNVDVKALNQLVAEQVVLELKVIKVNTSY